MLRISIKKERLPKIYPRCYVMTNREIKYVLLQTQYRMHEQFMKFPNEQFYGGKLNVGCTNEIDYLQTKYRVIFIIDTMGEETKDSANSYFYNRIFIMKP